MIVGCAGLGLNLLTIAIIHGKFAVKASLLRRLEHMADT